MDLYTKEIGRQLRKKCGTLFRKQNYKPLQQRHVKVSLRPNKGVTFCEKIVLKNLIISLNLSI
jgi:hypothetical protein